MTERTTRKMVRFVRPAILAGISGELPAGSYEIETDEEMIPGLSFQSYRRVRTTIIVRDRSASSASKQAADMSLTIWQQRSLAMPWPPTEIRP